MANELSIRSEKFEKQIKRIHELIEQPGSAVTWDDRIPDPDNPSQARQIDITIRRSDKLTIIECRIHKKKQDVKWIEEIIGRKLSLKANAAIAVSASGFTIGALAKAKAFGIILRDIQTLTEEEIAAWGHNTKTWLTYQQYSHPTFTFLFDRDDQLLQAKEIISEMHKEGRMFFMLERIAREIDEKNPNGTGCNFRVNFSELPYRLKGRLIKEVIFEARVDFVKRELNIPSIVAYDAPETPISQRSVFVEDFDFGEFEITQSSNKVAVIADFSLIKNPPNSFFRYVAFDFKRIVKLRGFEIIGKPELEIPLNDMVIKSRAMR